MLRRDGFVRFLDPYGRSPLCVLGIYYTHVKFINIIKGRYRPWVVSRLLEAVVDRVREPRGSAVVLSPGVVLRRGPRPASEGDSNGRRAGRWDGDTSVPGPVWRGSATTTGRGASCGRAAGEGYRIPGTL